MKTRKRIVLLLVCLLFFLAASGLLWNRWQKSGQGEIPQISVTLNGEPLLQHGGDWRLPVLGGLLTRHLEGNYPAIGTVLSVSQSHPVLSVFPADAALTRVRLQEQKGQTVIYDGSAAGFADLILMDGVDYFLEVWGELNRGTQGTGNFYFDASLSVRLPDPSFVLSTDAASQGDLIAVTAQNLPDGVLPTGESALGYVRFSPTGEAGSYTALVPVGYAQAPGEYSITITAGDQVATLPLHVSETAFEVQQMTISEEISDQTVNSDAANWEFHLEVVPLYDTASDELYFKCKFIQPVEGRISTPYGVMRYVNGSSTPERHGGIDIAAARGTPVLCPADGVVEYADFLQLSGNTIVIEHGGGLKSYFYHMDGLAVSAGESVTQGTQLGTVGSTGYSTGPHLHYEVKIGRQSISPWPLFDGSSSIFTAIK